MCGRFALTSSPEELARRFGLDAPPQCAPRYNVAPGQDVLAVRAEESGPERRAVWLRWGLVPPWAESAAQGARWINARSETAASKAAFRAAFAERRCLVPASGFYEWAQRGDFRQPYWIAPVDGAPRGLAGRWERWRSPDDEWLETCTLLTAEAPGRLRELHPRVPVILPPEAYGAWLDPAARDPERVSALLRPLSDAALRFHPVSPRVNRVEIDDSRCVEPAPEPPRQPSLFGSGDA